MTQTIRVSTASADYDAVIEPGLLGSLEEHLRHAVPSARAVFLVIDSNLPAETKRAALDALSAYRTSETEITPSEPVKSIETWQRLLHAFAEHRLERTDCVVALGGGIVGDTAGFAAAAYRRGVHIVQCPTTLLAMVDASVGGKTGINLALAGTGEHASSLLKNFVGSFHQPSRVLADVSTLQSLTRRDFAAGLAECIKHCMIAGGFGRADLGTWLDEHVSAILERDERALAGLVAQNIELKAAVVATDERETASGPAGRALLNLGHTFAHAIETLPNISHTSGKDLLHGEAVALGLVAAGTYAVRTNSLPDSDLELLISRLELAGLPTSAAGLPDPDAIIARMHDDKKAAGGRLRLVVPADNATASVTSDTDAESLHAAVESICR